MHQGYQLNYPLIAVTTTQHNGPLPASKSFFEVQEDNVVITAVKKDADDNSLIVRFYEWAGKKGDVHLKFGGVSGLAVSATETNLMEVSVGPGLAVGREGNVIVVPTNPYEIKTVKVTFGK